MKFERMDPRPSLVGGTPIPTTRARFKNMKEQAFFLRLMIDKNAVDMGMREFALKLTRDVAARDEEEMALVCAEWVQTNIKYQREYRETFQDPHTTLKPTIRAGDCDDHTTLTLSLIGALGIKGKACLLKIDGRWAHIFPVAHVRTKQGVHRMTLDTTLDEPVRQLVNPIAKMQAKGHKVETLFA